MIRGNQAIFAIESGISQAYDTLSLRALGYFLIHIKSFEYGIRSSDATMLANSFDEVKDRIINKGKHEVFFASDPEAGKIADAIIKSIYAPDQENNSFFGITCSQFTDLIYSKNIIWAPDGDAAFDDGSFVIQFDIDNNVRLIGFKRNECYQYELQSLRDLWIEADTFYDILKQWVDSFEAEWSAQQHTRPKQIKRFTILN